jgi:acyl transferase domain-containing protein
VSAAFHSPLARSAVEPLGVFLDKLELAAPRIDVYGNADAATYRRESGAVRERLAEHPAAPVRFLDQIEAMYADGVRTFVEVGAGSALTGLTGQILGDREHLAVSLDKRGRDGVTAWYEGLGRLAVRGVPMDLTRLSLDADPTSSRAGRPRMSVRVNGAGYTPPAAPSPVRTTTLALNTPTPLEPSTMTEPDPSAQWLAAVQEMQRQTAEAHMHFQRVLADSHQAFLQLAENTFAAFTGQAPPAPPQQAPQQAPALAAAPVLMPPAPEPQVALPSPHCRCLNRRPPSKRTRPNR